MENSIIKKVRDYIPLVLELFPELSEEEINRILLFGWRMYYYVNSRGCDVLVKDTQTHKLTAYTGMLHTDSLKHYGYGLIKWKLHDRMMYRLRRKEWDGYYYIGLRVNQFNDMQDLLSHNRRKFIKFKNAFCYKLLEELRHDKSIDYIFRFKYPMDVGFKFYMKLLRVPVKDLEFVELNKENLWQNRQ